METESSAPAPLPLQTDRASYIPQDRSALTDEELAREQAELPDPMDGLRG